METIDRKELSNNIIGDYILSQAKPTKFGKIHDSVGFAKVDGAIRQLTLRERLYQIINLGQPQDINGVRTTVRDAELLSELMYLNLLDEEVINTD